MSSLLNANQDIKPITIEEEMRSSYLDYAISVIVARALPDAKDGLKPVHRRILYAMYESGCHYNRAYKKSARIVGEVMGKYHPHGDSAIYDSLVRMAQDFSLRVPLIDGQGNFGSVDKDDPAAMRYTESRLEKISHTMLEDIDKQTVLFNPNYDGSEKEPTVLPAAFPNLLVNGSSGIAVGMATSIPPHNLAELINASLALIDNPETSIDELIEIVPAPDFPTGAFILRNSGLYNALSKGQGSVRMRSRATIEEMKNGKGVIIITEIPYQVVKAVLIEAIAHLVKDKTIDGITDIRDESNKEGIRIVIETRRDADANVILSQIYKFTDAECNFPCSMLALNNYVPQILNIKSALEIFIRFREEIIAKRTEFLLGKVKDRAHILIGLAVAVDFIDAIVKTIRESENVASAKEKLLSTEWNAIKVTSLIDLIGDTRNHIVAGQFKFTEEQVKAILEMRLSKLTGLERNEIVGDLESLAKDINKYTEILENRTILINLMKSELIAVRDQFGTPRRTEIIIDDSENDIESLIQKEDIIVSYTLRGYIKRDVVAAQAAQKRGGKGKTSIRTNDDDCIIDVFIASTHSDILFFTNIGRVYKLKGYKIPQGSSQSKGRALVNLITMQDGEKVTNFLAIPENTENSYLIFATKLGIVRKSSIDDFRSVNSNGKIAISLSENDALVGVRIAEDSDHILLAAHGGQAVRFMADSLRLIKSRASFGVSGMDVAENDAVVSICILGKTDKNTEIRDEFLKIPLELRILFKNMDESQMVSEIAKLENKPSILPTIAKSWAGDEEFLLSITENGYGKRTSTHEYRITSRGGKGVKNIITSERNGGVVASFVIPSDYDVIITSSSGKIVRCPVSGISTSGRSTQGVKIISLENGEKVISATFVRPEPEEIDGEVITAEELL